MTRINRLTGQLSQRSPLADARAEARNHPDGWRDEPHSPDRFHLQLPALVIPLLPDGRPDVNRQREGTLVQVADQRLNLQLDELCCPPGSPLVVGIQAPNCQVQYGGVEVHSAATCSNGKVLLEACPGGAAESLLHPRTLTPRFHFDSLTFSFGLSPELLRCWEDVGVLQAVVIDRLLLCPRCHGLPTFRNGCRNCGSGRVVPSEDAAYQCQDCHWCDRELAALHQCLHCAHRFFTPEGYEMVLQGYHVQRLDLAALERVLR